MMGMIAAVTVDGEPAATPTGPEGDPTSVSAYFYSGSLVGLQWVAGDGSAYTEIGLSGSAVVEPTSASDIVSPGVTTYETGVTTEEHWWVRHQRGGIFGDWVVIPGPE